MHWGGKTYEAWAWAAQALQTGQSSFINLTGADFFDWLRDRAPELQEYHGAMAAYARHDYQSLADSADFGVHDAILDVGGGTGDLSFALLCAFPGLTAIVMDRPEVVEVAGVPWDVADCCRFVPGDLFRKWPVWSDAVVLARVFHDWSDDDAVRILGRAREAMSEGARFTWWRWWLTNHPVPAVCWT